MNVPDPTNKQRVHLPVIEQKSSIHLDGSRAYVHPADVHGRFATARKVAFAVLIAIYALLPWVQVGGHPAMFLDIEHRSFYLFGASFNSQDIWMMAFLLTGALFGLVYLTSIAGRVWCGWACPQTVFLEGVFRRIERLVEGPREKRMRRNAGPWTFDKIWRKSVVWPLYLASAFVIAHVFLAYFVSIPQLFDAMRHNPSDHPEAFAVVMGLTAVLFFNFAWFREQFCVILCPYGRLQSALLDPDSLVVGYDVARGEPRGKAKKAHAVHGPQLGSERAVLDPAAALVDGDVGTGATPTPVEKKLGDCVDCGRCVVVCPTGIDIRAGLQMDCLACTACIDACDEIMDKLERPRGLIRYDSQQGLAGEPRRFLRPRVYLYTALGLVGLAAATFAYSGRVDFEANVLRVQGAPYTLEAGAVRNAFNIHLINKRSSETLFRLEPEPMAGATFVIPMREIRLAPLAQANAPVFVTIPESNFQAGLPFKVRVVPVGHDQDARVMSAPFLGPKR